MSNSHQPGAAATQVIRLPRLHNTCLLPCAPPATGLPCKGFPAPSSPLHCLPYALLLHETSGALLHELPHFTVALGSSLGLPGTGCRNQRRREKGKPGNSRSSSSQSSGNSSTQIGVWGLQLNTLRTTSWTRPRVDHSAPYNCH